MTRRRPTMVIHRRAVPVTAPTAAPLRAVITLLDSAKCTGVATYIEGRLWDYRQCNARVPAERLSVIRDHMTAAYVRQLPHALVIEVPYGGFQAAALSLAATAALWRDTWVQCHGMPARCIERTAAQWRRLLFGKATREAARALEAALAHQVVVRDMRGRPVSAIGGDAAAAICIGQVMIRSRELHVELGCELVRR